MARGESPLQSWRAWCRREADRLCAWPSEPALRRRLEGLEQQLIGKLQKAELPLTEQAIAFRTVVELRGCTARDLATYFNVDPRVVVLGISLLELPAQRSAAAPLVHRSIARSSRSKVA